MRSISNIGCTMLLLAGGCGGAGPADSSTAAFATVAARVGWAHDRLGRSRPSDVIDAQFREVHSARRGGPEGPAYTTRYVAARLTIDPADAPKWAAATRPRAAPHGMASLQEASPVAMTAAEFGGCSWHDPTPIFGSASGGSMGISADRRFVFVYQVRN